MNPPTEKEENKDEDLATFLRINDAEEYSAKKIDRQKERNTLDLARFRMVPFGAGAIFLGIGFLPLSIVLFGISVFVFIFGFIQKYSEREQASSETMLFFYGGKMIVASILGFARSVSLYIVFVNNPL